jgi:hypothetical protein
MNNLRIFFFKKFHQKFKQDFQSNSVKITLKSNPITFSPPTKKIDNSNKWLIIQQFPGINQLAPGVSISHF